MLGGQARPAWLAGGALVLFAACFVAAVEAAHRQVVADPVRGAVAPAQGRLRAVLILTMTVIAFACTLAWGAQWMAMFVFVVVTGVFLVPLRLAPLAIPLVAAAAVAVEVAGGWDVVSATTAGSWALSIVMAGYITLLLRRRGVLIAALRRTQTEVARLAAADAVTDERLRFARDLHDLLGHSLSVIVLKAELARRLLERGREDTQAQVEVSEVEQIARRALVEVREAVAGYRTRTLAAELDRGRAALAAAGIELAVTGVPVALPPTENELLAWIVREATTNIVRHSSARHAQIAVAVTDAEVSLKMTNDGDDSRGAAAGTKGGATHGTEFGTEFGTKYGTSGGITHSTTGGAGDGATGERETAGGGREWQATVQNGSGLLGLQERVAAAGGRFAAGPAAGGGFRVEAVVPFTASPPPAGQSQTAADESQTPATDRAVAP